MEADTNTTAHWKIYMQIPSGFQSKNAVEKESLKFDVQNNFSYKVVEDNYLRLDTSSQCKYIYRH